VTMENDSDHPLSDGDALWGELPATTSGDSDEDVTNGSGVPQCHPALSSTAATAASRTTLTDAEEVTSNVNHNVSELDSLRGEQIVYTPDYRMLSIENAFHDSLSTVGARVLKFSWPPIVQEDSVPNVTFLIAMNCFSMQTSLK
jgi:hypothetical protein